MNRPSHLLLPSAAALPVRRLSFTETAKRRLIRNGIVSALQLAEIASRHPQHLAPLSGLTATKVRKTLEAELGRLPDFVRTAVSFDPVPAAGLPSRPMATGAATPDTVRALIARLDRLQGLPTRVALSAQMQPVGHQGPFPTCVGWSANALREFDQRRPMSPGYAYRGAKARDEAPGFGGTWLRYAMEHLYVTGHVTPSHYSYRSAIRAEPIDHLANIAAGTRSAGYADLNVFARQPTCLPRLMKALLAGRLHPEIGPQPVAVGLALHDSFVSTASALDGMIPMPFPGEIRNYGHAMVAVGYVEQNDPNNPFGLSYFIVRNSWGTTWAGENPFGEPGHALIPEQYFARPNLVLEAHVCLGR